MNVLIIDDDAVDRISTTRILQQSELPIGAIHQAGTGDEGIRMAVEKRYDMILLDYKLPPTNGIEVLRELRGSSDFSTAIVMLSHSNDDELALRCIEAGAQDFIMKSEVTALRLKRALLISSERHFLEEKVLEGHNELRRLAEQDSLTGLSNRYFFDESLKDAIPQAERSNKTLALIFIDLDNFKSINDTMGHLAGDNYLLAVAKRLEKSIRKGDRLSRLGGDEFAILANQIAEPYQIRLLVEKIFSNFSEPTFIEGQPVDISASIGVATYPECGTTAVELMKSADVAMYRAKENGRNQVQYYSRDFHEKIENRINLERDLKNAIQNNELVLYYQPQINTNDHSLAGVEALIRWNHPQLGLVPPDQFISIAEECDLINSIGRWVLDSACEQFSTWVRSYPDMDIVFSIAVNISAKQLRDKGLVEYLQQCIDNYNIPASRLEIELTESSLESSLVALDMLNALSASGIKLALDDFGTGYSSLSHLDDFPFDILKIDKKFIMSIEREEQAKLLKAVTNFAHSMDYETVAEGVETELQLEICKKLGINRLQGFYFSKPIPANEIEKAWF
jgi:diguanylate cyclase (GGDEF)-like protein